MGRRIMERCTRRWGTSWYRRSRRGANPDGICVLPWKLSEGFISGLAIEVARGAPPRQWNRNMHVSEFACSWRWHYEHHAHTVPPAHHILVEASCTRRICSTIQEELQACSMDTGEL